MINTILFDLDGTLQNMDINLFTKIYFEEMAKVFNGFIDKKSLENLIWATTKFMVDNKEHRSNKDVFFEKFTEMVKGDFKKFLDGFNLFYSKGYLKTKKAISEKKFVSKTLELLKSKGYMLILATNPLFPRIAITPRIIWAGIKPELFSFISTYENSSYCKPNLEYYSEILEKIQKKPQDCMMIGNDVEEDMVAANLGISTFLIDDQLISRGNLIKSDYQGSFVDFSMFANKLPCLLK